MRALVVSLLFCVLLPATLLAKERRPLPTDDDVLGILQYVYYWHLDYADVAGLDPGSSIDVFLSPLEIELDPGHETEFVQLLVPALDLDITLKKANYDVGELGLGIEHTRPKIAAVQRGAAPPDPEVAYTVKSYATKDVLAAFFAQRRQAGSLDAATRARLNDALRTLVGDEGKAAAGRNQTFYVAPVSTYSNNVWIYWLQQKQLILFASDLSIRSPAYWEHLPVFTRVFELDRGVVTSVNEVPGSNAHVTKSWAGRIVLNALVDGYPIQLTPAAQ